MDTLVLIAQNVVLTVLVLFCLEWFGITRKTSNGVKLFFAGLVIALVISASTLLSLA